MIDWSLGQMLSNICLRAIKGSAVIFLPSYQIKNIIHKVGLSFIFSKSLQLLKICMSLMIDGDDLPIHHGIYIPCFERSSDRLKFIIKGKIIPGANLYHSIV